jgi:hypothetical protein
VARKKKGIYNLKTMNINRIVDSYPTKWPEGFIREEQESLCKELGIDFDTYCEKLGVNTCMMRAGQTITYHCDVETAIRLCVENRDRRLSEWD